MNNIEILEMQLKKIKDFCKDNNNYYPEELPYYMFWNGKQAEIAENLIQENKELKEKLEEKDMQHELELIGKEEYTKDAMGEIIEHYYTANEDCIPKSKIKEKIEEYERKLKQPGVQNINTAAYSYYLGKKEGWEELLKEGELYERRND